MKTDRMALLLPCDTIESLALDRPPAEAQELLTGWTAMWHPALLLATGELPEWHSASCPPADDAQYLFVLPECSRALLPTGWLEGHGEAAPRVVAAGDDRSRLTGVLLEAAESAVESCDPELLADFRALGFAYFLIELLTRQLRYMSSLDETSFRAAVIEAAQEAGKGNAADAGRRLQSGFDLLGDAREYFYPVESRLLDLTLVAPTTLGRSLQESLRGPEPVNLLVTGELIERMATECPETLAMIKDGIEEKRLGLIGGEYAECPLPLLPPEAIRFHLERGLAVYERHLGHRPKVYGRRRFGLTPVLPPILRQLGFEAALHFTLDDGRFPAGNQSRVQWQGVDGRNFDAVARLPLDAACPGSFLRLAERLGDVMDVDHEATAVFAHWPGTESIWYDDLRRAVRSGRMFGSFSVIDDYFEHTAMSGQTADYSPDQYRAPYLRQSVAAGEPDPISRWTAYFRNWATIDAIRAMETAAACVSDRIDAEAQDRVESLVDQVEQAHYGNADASLNSALEWAWAAAAQRLAMALGFRAGPPLFGAEVAARQTAGERAGMLVLNPHTAPRRVCLPWPEPVALPDTSETVRAAGGAGLERAAVVDVPAMGFARVAPGGGPAQVESDARQKPARRWRKPKRKLEPPMAEELEERFVLRNEHCEVVFDKYTGAIRGISDYRTRGARLAQQIALRLPDPREADPADDAHYTIQAADGWHITSAGPLVGEVCCRGRLVSREGRRMAGFRQSTRLWRGGRVVEMEIELEPEAEPGANPWDSYYAARFAWNDATANLYRSVSQLSFPTDANLLEAPHFIDVRTADGRSTLLCNGLPYHRRFGLRRLDTLLVVRGETARKFRLGIGLDVAHPVHAAMEELCPLPVLPLTDPGSSDGGWLFHLDHRNVLVTSWAALGLGKDVMNLSLERPEGRSAQEVAGPSSVSGLRLRLLELDGRSTQLGLRLLRRPVRAEKRDAPGRPQVPLDVADDRVAIPLAAREWAEVEVWFDEER